MRDFNRLSCDECGEAFTHPTYAAGRPPRYCGRACQSRASSRDYRNRQKQRLHDAQQAASAPASSHDDVQAALTELAAVTDELRALRTVLRVPQRMDEAVEQTRTARDQIDVLTGRLDQALRTLRKAD